MSKINMFLQAALEEAATAGAVGVDAIHHTETLQPKPGLGKTEYDDLAENKAQVGKDHPFAEHDEIDTVAESQEHTLALEHLQAAIERYSRVACALEEIADSVQTKLDAGEDMSAADTLIVANAVDAAGVGEPLAEGIAMESFDFSRRVATESFMEAVSERAQKVWEAVAKFTKRVFEETSKRMKRFADYFRSIKSILTNLEKDIDVTEGLVGKNFENAEREKKIQKSFASSSSVKTPVDVVRGAAVELDRVAGFVSDRVQADINALQRVLGDGEAGKTYAAMGKVLASLKALVKLNSDSKFTTVPVSVEMPQTLAAGTDGFTKAVKTKTGSPMQEFDSNLKIAGPSDIDALHTLVNKAQSAMDAALSAFQNGEMTFPKGKAKKEEGAEKADHKELVSKYRNLINLATDVQTQTTFGAAHGLYYNFFAATGWVRASIAEARAMRAAQAK